MLFGKLIHAMPIEAGIKRIGHEHGAIGWPDINAVMMQHAQIIFEIVADLGDGRIFQQRL